MLSSGRTAAKRSPPKALWVSTSMQTRGGITSYIRDIQETSLWTDWNIRHVATHRDGSKWTKLAAFMAGASSFAVELIRFRPSLVHLHSSADASFIRKSTLLWMSRLAGVPVVMHMHGSDFQRYYDESPRFLQAAIRITLSQANAVVALGDAWAAKLRAIAPSARIRAIPNAGRPAQPVSQPGSGETVRVVFLGQIGERKGAFRLLRAWALLESPDATLTMAGDGSVDEARSLVRELGMQDSVEVNDWMSPDAVSDLLGRSHVLVLPSRDEGQPMAVIEAMARGLCVIASDVGGMGEMIRGGCGVIVPPDDVDAIAAGLRLVIDDPELRARCGAAAFARLVQQYDVRTLVRRLDSLYRDAIASNGAAVSAEIGSAHFKPTTTAVYGP